MLSHFIIKTFYEADITTTIFTYFEIIIIDPTLQIRKWRVEEINLLPKVT